jgi:DNA-binding beta-propeller fold protein YncE
MAFLALALVGTACGGQPQLAPPAGGLVYLGAGQGAPITIADAATGATGRTLPAGTLAAGWLYRAAGGTLQRIDAVTGAVAATTAVPGWAQAVRTSAGGSWLALAESRPSDVLSRFQLRDAASARPAVDVELAGRFTFDGLSDDGQHLYLLQWLSPGRYHVRRFDVGAGGLNPQVIYDKREFGQDMTGDEVSRATTADGLMQITLYQRSAKGQAFLHTLPLDASYPGAYCIDLPAPAAGWGLVAAPDGRHFFAVNPGTGGLVALTQQGTNMPDVRQARIQPQGVGMDAVPAAAVSPDGATLYVAGAGGVVAMDTRSLAVKGRWLQSEPITGLAFSADGSWLYAIGRHSEFLRIDPRTMAVVQRRQLDGVVASILRVS